MVYYSVAARELGELRSAHRRTGDRRAADRIKAVVMLASGRPAEYVADALLIDPTEVRNHSKRYQQGGLSARCTWPTAAVPAS